MKNRTTGPGRRTAEQGDEVAPPHCRSPKGSPILHGDLCFNGRPRSSAALVQLTCRGGQGPWRAAHLINALARRDIKRLLARPSESGVGGLARYLDGPEILTLGVEHLNACDRGDVHPVIAIDRYAVCAAFGARGNVAKLRERAVGLESAVGLRVIDEYRWVEGVIDDQGFAVSGQCQPVWSRDAAVEQDRHPRAGWEVVHVGWSARHHWPRAGVGEIDTAFGIHQQVVGRKERRAGRPFGDGCDGAVLVALGDALAATFSE